MFQSGFSACSRVPPSLRSVPSYSWKTPQFRVALELGSRIEGIEVRGDVGAGVGLGWSARSGAGFVSRLRRI
ncbi:predicted protein [Streptomyces iranensis]|uniref:Uncharacterized protein n=1 Tax=Streptomyces iranensis TaxID=576784 RepID=A0A060ZQX6_9ACTN|nr:predicted protein [Streptomyces iranensis]